MIKKCGKSFKQVKNEQQQRGWFSYFRKKQDQSEEDEEEKLAEYNVNFKLKNGFVEL